MRVNEMSFLQLRQAIVGDGSQMALKRVVTRAGLEISQARICQIEKGQVPAPERYRALLELLAQGIEPRLVPVSTCMDCGGLHHTDRCSGHGGSTVVLGEDEMVVPRPLHRSGPPPAVRQRAPRDRHSISLAPENWRRFNGVRQQYGLSWEEFMDRAVDMLQRSAWFTEMAAIDD